MQRGVRPERQDDLPVELSLADGFPDASNYVFYPEKADAIAEKLLDGQPGLKLSPLVWNLRPGHFQAAIDETDDATHMYLYRGRIYLPDGHHRHQGILKAFRLWEDAQADYPNFDSERQFTVDIYFMSRQDEAEYFFQKNWLTQQVDRSKSYDLTEQDCTLSSGEGRYRQGAEPRGERQPRYGSTRGIEPASHHALDAARGHADGRRDRRANPAGDRRLSAPAIAVFWEMLAQVRRELQKLEVDERRESRKQSMAAQAVVMHGYAQLLRRFLKDVEDGDLDSAAAEWQPKLNTLVPGNQYEHSPSSWKGDFFSRENPMWQEIGVLQQTKRGGQAVSNVRQTRDQVGKVLTERIDV